MLCFLLLGRKRLLLALRKLLVVLLCLQVSLDLSLGFSASSCVSAQLRLFGDVLQYLLDHLLGLGPSLALGIQRLHHVSLRLL